MYGCVTAVQQKWTQPCQSTRLQYQKNVKKKKKKKVGGAAGVQAKLGIWKLASCHRDRWRRLMAVASGGWEEPEW